MSDWTFELARSIDLTPIDELDQASGRRLDLALNRAGAFTFNLPLASDLAYQIEEIKTCILCKFKQEIVWSGPVWQINEQTPDSLAISSVGWLQTLEDRITKPSWQVPALVYLNKDAGEIAMDLLNRSNADAGALNSPIWVRPGFVHTTFARDRTYQPFSQILTEISALSELESGFDMLVDPVSRELDIYVRISSEKPDVLFEYGSNLTSVQRTSDGSKICNRLIAYGAGNTQAEAIDAESVSEYGLMEEAVSLSDVSNPSILLAFAGAEVAIRSRPEHLRIHSFTPRKYIEGDPRLFENFNIGDVCRLTAERGRLAVRNQPVRVFGASLSFDQAGNEQLENIQTTAGTS